MNRGRATSRAISVSMVEKGEFVVYATNWEETDFSFCPADEYTGYEELIVARYNDGEFVDENGDVVDM